MISRGFSALSGHDLGGAAHVDVAGQIQPLDGMFDVNINGVTRDLKVGVDQADAVLVGETVLSVAALRDETGTFVRDLSLENAALTATGGAELRSNNSQARFMAKLTNIALISPQYSGPCDTVGAGRSRQPWLDSRRQRRRSLWDGFDGQRAGHGAKCRDEICRRSA